MRPLAFEGIPKALALSRVLEGQSLVPPQAIQGRIQTWALRSAGLTNRRSLQAYPRVRRVTATSRLHRWNWCCAKWAQSKRVLLLRMTGLRTFADSPPSGGLARHRDRSDC